ncbi:MAG: imidazolonepropionase [Pseudomonadota bacterium]|nr:imidazolonepropionase [Pseudomonadota bacterium]
MTEGGEPYGALADCAVAVADGRIAWIGPAAEASARALAEGVPTEDCEGRWMLPGLIDCHTHLVYGGNRVAEFEQRLCGISYEEIARAGGGIQSTVKATCAAGAQALLEGTLRRARALLAEGVTTIEIKSGYGLDLAVERQLLEVAREVGRRLPLSVKTTYLGLHALPPQYRGDRARFVNQVCGPWLEELVAAGLVDAVDAFCENIAFTLAETAQLLRAASCRGLRAHVHAGQLSDMGAAELAAEHGALSADHLEYLSAAGARALAAAGTTAVLLPGAYYMLRQTTPPPVGLLREAGVSMAIATDCNPGSSPCTSLLLTLNMACTLFGLSPLEALRGVTLHAARALGIEGDAGTLEVGKQADFALYRIDRPAELCYNLGANPCAEVVRAGERVALPER